MTLRRGPRVAQSETKRLVIAARGRDLVDHLDDETVTIARMAADDDGIEGVRAFLEKRPALFR